MSKKLKKSPEYSVFFNTLIDLCDNQGISVTNIVEQFSSSKSAMTAWKNGKISVDLIPKLAQELNCSVSALFNCKEKNSSNELSEDEQELLRLYNSLSNLDRCRVRERAQTLQDLAEEEAQKHRANIIQIKYNGALVSAGLGDELPDYEQWDTISVIETKESRKADFILVVDGDSMTPKFNDGDLVLIRQQPAVDIGQIGVFDRDGKGYIKKFGGNRLISLNPQYDDIYINSDDYRCFGLVLGIAETV